MKTPLAILGTAAVLAVPSLSQALVLDSFEELQLTEDVPTSSPPPDSESEQAAAVPGGFRDIDAENFTNAIQGTQANTNSNSLGLFNVSNGSTTRGQGTITWDGEDGDARRMGTDRDGLGGVDLTADGSNAFAFDVVAIDLPYRYILRVFDMDGNRSVERGNISRDDEGSTIQIGFSEFAGIDFASIGALQLTLRARVRDADISIDDFRTTGAIPIPASLPMFFAALGGLGLLGRRRRSA